MTLHLSLYVKYVQICFYFFISNLVDHSHIGPALCEFPASGYICTPMVFLPCDTVLIVDKARWRNRGTHICNKSWAALIKMKSSLYVKDINHCFQLHVAALRNAKYYFLFGFPFIFYNGFTNGTILSRGTVI